FIRAVRNPECSFGLARAASRAKRLETRYLRSLLRRFSMSEPKSGSKPPVADSHEGALKLSRRTLIELLGASSASALPSITRCDCSSSEPGGPGAPEAKPSFGTTLRRRDDLLFL